MPSNPIAPIVSIACSGRVSPALRLWKFQLALLIFGRAEGDGLVAAGCSAPKTAPAAPATMAPVVSFVNSRRVKLARWFIEMLLFKEEEIQITCCETSC